MRHVGTKPAIDEAFPFYALRLLRRDRGAEQARAQIQFWRTSFEPAFAG